MGMEKIRHILCYGDSNTFGWDPVARERLAGGIRWPGQLRRMLGEGYEVVEEGLGGRTVANHDPIQPGRSGLDMLRFCLETHTPLELVIVMLGTNDLKKAYHMAPSEIARGMEEIVKVIKSPLIWNGRGETEILLVSPVWVRENIAKTEFGDMFGGEKAHRYSKELAKEYRKVAKGCGCHFLDGAKEAEASVADGIHMDAQNHEKLARAIYNKICSINKGNG